MSDEYRIPDDRVQSMARARQYGAELARIRRRRAEVMRRVASAAWAVALVLIAVVVGLLLRRLS